MSRHTEGKKGEAGEERGQAERQVIDICTESEEIGVWQIRDTAGLIQRASLHCVSVCVRKKAAQHPHGHRCYIRAEQSRS